MTFLAGLALGCIVTALRRRLAQTEAARDEWRERALQITRKDVR